jgi:hypothetical protein
MANNVTQSNQNSEQKQYIKQGTIKNGTKDEEEGFEDDEADAYGQEDD